ncbi:transferrin receptor-like dimerization domain-containing protein [Cellulophaga sp. BC115SP]|uniref:transferrin receptor-like dimerization domain-containing protein n=1 Tax=Cellulophaga sp. BC115SP TaxID=2683263 RepID=UPI00141252CA|nr:transferrin receptor-like dimerization domain-containing protein [Cellulophaga sp. BC115SP]NBB30245.1 M28 family peptidase [Cellulophaga sp. BC115SP]
MKKLITLLGFLCLGQLTSSAQNLLGFSEKGTASEKELEAKFDAQLNAQNLRTWMKFMSSKPHYVGSPHNRANAVYMRDLFKSWGFEARIDTLYTLFPTPKVREVSLVSPTIFKASLVEPMLKEDGTSNQLKDHLPTYNCFSADGDVTAELVYVNFGRPDDYEVLEKIGVSVKGKIVIVRYGGSWRGLKPKLAAEKGAVGCIIYSDPKDDGYGQGDVYPKGPFRPEAGAQRGSVLDLPVAPGDPLTPGYGDTKDAKRLEVKDATTIMTIPVLPISYGDALPLLKALDGRIAPESWRGGLPIAYHVGPGAAKVHLKLQFDFKVEPLFNVIAVMKGSEFPDQWILRGNHHDAWVFGAADPLSGMVAVMEEARAIGELAKTGWKPKRTLVFCAWDGEEPGLLGSTEWAEANRAELQKKAVAYLNSDGNGRGFLSAGGSHTLEKFFNQVSRDVIDPQKNISVYDRLRSYILVNGSGESKKEALSRGDIRIGALGSGSDFTPFLQHLGVSAMNVGYGGEDEGGEYHSIYDSFDHYTRFKDPDFAYGVTLAKTMGRTVLRLANADVLPFEFQNFSNTLQNYGTEVKALLENIRSKTEENNRLVKEGHFAAAADPNEPIVVKTYEEVPYINFAPLENSLNRLNKSANAYASVVKNSNKLAPAKLEALNQLLYTIERTLTLPEGLPNRPWYKHQIYAPGFFTGYGVKTIPSVRESIEQRKWKDAEKGIEIVSSVLNKYCDQIDKAVALLGE